jgi:DNA-binding transcriptional ArsR family regulator
LDYSRAFKALGHPLRLRILDYVRERARVGQLVDGVAYWVEPDEHSCRKALAAKFGVPLSTLAHHLRLLHQGGLLRLRKQKASVSLALDEPWLAQLGQFLIASRKPTSRQAAPAAERLILNDSRPARAGRPPGSVPDDLHRLMQRMRARYFGGRGGVDYWGFSRSPEFAEMQRVMWSLRTFSPAGLGTSDEATAFWLNLYNLLFLHAVVKLGIERSVSEIGTACSEVAYLVGGQAFTASDIEHGILRQNRTATNRPYAQFGGRDSRRRLILERLDPRVHFAMVCGTRSCPAIAAYSGTLLDSQLEAATVSYLGSEVQLAGEEGALILPMMFNWYREDFETYPGGLIAFFLRYLPFDERRLALERNPDIELRYKEWDWRLNRVER